MTPELARQALRIHPDATLTPALVEEAYAAESAARHPALYLDAAQRRAAEDWAAHLAQARHALLAVAAAPAPRRRRLSGGAIAGIVAGAVVLAVLFGAAGLAIGRFATEAAEQVAVVAEEAAEDAAEYAETAPTYPEPGVARYSAEQTFYTFPAALEVYDDGRHDALCPAELLEGCWQEAVVPEQECAAMHVRIGYFVSAEEYYPEEQEVVEVDGVDAGEVVPVVYGHDGYDWGWITDVVCIDY